MKTKRKLLYFFILVFVLDFFPAFAGACGGGEIKLNLYLGKGDVGEEELMIVVNPQDKKNRKAYKVYDDDGVANIMFMAALSGNLSKDELQELKPQMIKSLKKSIAYWEKWIREESASNPLANVEKAKHAVDESKKLLKDLESSQLQMSHFVTYVKKIAGPFRIVGMHYSYKEYNDGQFKAVPDAKGLDDIISSEVYQSIVKLDDDIKVRCPVPDLNASLMNGSHDRSKIDSLSEQSRVR